MTAVSRLVSIEIARDIKDICRGRMSLELDLNLLSPGVKSQTLTNLRRGWISSLSGQAYTIYQVLAAKYDFPVFSVGRAERCILSLPVRDRDNVEEINKQLRIMWQLANPDTPKEHVEWRFRTYTEEGHNPNWVQCTATRPQQLDIRALCHMLNVDNIFQIVPKEHTLEAMRAIDQGALIDITGHMRFRQ
jgi:hypothetical protein